MSKKLIVGSSPISHKIYAGSLLKDGITWGANRCDVTDTAVSAVASHLIGKDEKVVFTHNNGKKYVLSCVEQKEID